METLKEVKMKDLMSLEEGMDIKGKGIIDFGE